MKTKTMTQVEVKKTDSKVTAAFKANLVPETSSIYKTEDGKLMMTGQSAGNYKTVTVELVVKD